MALASCVALAAAARGLRRLAGRRQRRQRREGGRGASESAKVVDVSKAGDVTLTVWDQEVRGGQAKQIKQLNEAFQAKYPNVTIKRVAKSFDDLNTTLKLAVSGDKKVPDVVQANQGRQVMGQLVKGGLLTAARRLRGRLQVGRPLLGDAAGPQPLLRRRQGVRRPASLYGLSQMGEIVGVYYNKDKVDTRRRRRSRSSRSQLEEAKGEGDVPIAFGNLDPFAGHPRVPDGAEPVRRQAGGPRLRVRQGRRVVRRRRRTRRRRPRSRTGRSRASSRPTSTAPATTRPGSSSPRARAAS